MRNIYLSGFAATLFLTIACNNAQQKTTNVDSTKLISKPVPGTAIKYDSSKRYIYLTWDDSPQPPGTVNCKTVFK